MKIRLVLILLTGGCLFFLLISCKEKETGSATVPIIIDHNRMLIDAEIQRKDSSWREVRLWVDSGNPEFFLSEELARDLGIDLTGSDKDIVNGQLEVKPPTGVRIGDMELSFEGIRSVVVFQPFWLFSTIHNDANLPSTGLKNYQVVFDYPGKKFTIADPGTLMPRGERIPANIHPKTGIVQTDVFIGGENFSLALDNGASYSFISKGVFDVLAGRNRDWPRITGALGCANMWGWWPYEEEKLPVMRLPEVLLEGVRLVNVGLVGVPRFSQNGPSLGDWYSMKTVKTVEGFLGSNAFNSYRVEIDYVNNAVYFERSADTNEFDMDMVGLTLRPEADGSYTIIGVADKNNKPVLEEIQPGDKLLQVDKLKTTGETMGTVVDALRGEPGDLHILILERFGERFKVNARVERFLN